MLATLGSHRFDVTHDAVLVAMVEASGPRPADVVASWTGRPDAVLVVADDDGAPVAGSGVRAWCDAVDLPVVVRSSRVEVVVGALDAGAVAIHDPSGLAHPAHLDAVVDAGASLIVGCPAEPPIDPSARAGHLVGLAERAVAAGVAPGRVVIDVTRGSGAAPETVRFLDEVPEVAGAGWPVMVVVAPSSAGPDGDLAVAAAHAVVLPRGARFVRSDDIRTTRRVASVVGELLRARDAAGTAR